MLNGESNLKTMIDIIFNNSSEKKISRKENKITKFQIIKDNKPSFKKVNGIDSIEELKCETLIFDPRPKIQHERQNYFLAGYIFAIGDDINEVEMNIKKASKILSFE